MRPKKSIAAGKFADTAKAEQTSANSKNAAQDRRINVQMVQNILLIWLDKNIDDNSTDCRNTIAQLRRAINTINTFTDDDVCIQFLNSLGKEKACMIISGSLGQHTVPRIHNMFQVDSIFILCDNKEFHEQWTKEWSKIKGVFTEIPSICEALKQAAQQCEQNAISISFMAIDGDNTKKNLDQLDPSFMYTQILKEILLVINFEEKHIAEFILYCRDVFADNERELKNVKKLERKYRDETPIWWYTFECFLYPMLNRVLRLMDVGIIIKMGFFVSDLHRHIDQLYEKQFGGQQTDKTFIVYRGQGMSKTEFEQMSKTKGGLISFNNFLSTSKNRTISFHFASRAVRNPDLMGILFVMTIDPSLSTTPFASITDVSYYKDKEDEVLFAMHTVFRIYDIKPIDENQRLFQVELTLTSDNDNDLRALTNRIREETDGSTGWDQLGQLLLKLGEIEKAQQVYEILLEHSTTENEKARAYYQIGWTKNCLGEYKEAIIFSEKALEIRQQSLPPNHPDLAKFYYDIGVLYRNMGEYSKALSSHGKALEIREQSVPPDYPALATSYVAHGLVYDQMGEYSKAIVFYEKALEIQNQSLPPNHPDLAKSYNNIGNAYFNMGEYSKALSYYEKALEIQQKTLPTNHPDLTASCGNIGLTYMNMGEHSHAISFLEKTLAIRQQLLSPNHPDLGVSYSGIGNAYLDMGEYSKALSSHEKALEIFEKTLPPNHPDLASSYNNIGNAYFYLGEYSKALSYYEKTYEIRQQSLPPNHPNLACCCDNIGLAYENLCNYSKARSFYERALEIGQQSLPSNYSNLETFRTNLDRVINK